jgi:hypothetical protein
MFTKCFAVCSLRKNKPKEPQNLHECRIQAPFDFQILSGIRLSDFFGEYV